MLAGVCVVVAVFVFFLLPETKGRSLEDMSVYFAEITGDNDILEAEKKIIADRERGALEMTDFQQQQQQQVPPTGELT